MFVCLHDYIVIWIVNDITDCNTSLFSVSGFFGIVVCVRK